MDCDEVSLHPHTQQQRLENVWQMKELQYSASDWQGICKHKAPYAFKAVVQSVYIQCNEDKIFCELVWQTELLQTSLQHSSGRGRGHILDIKIA